MGIIIVILALGFWFVIGLGLTAAYIAWKKGYPPWFWLVSMGPVGTLWILITPNLNRATTPEERERWETRANWTGGVLSGFTILPMFGLPLIGLVGALSYRSMAVGPPAPPPTVTATATVVEDETSSNPKPKPSDK